MQILHQMRERKEKSPNQQNNQTVTERISWFDEIIIQFQLGHIKRIRVLVSVHIYKKWPWSWGVFTIQFIDWCWNKMFNTKCKEFSFKPEWHLWPRKPEVRLFYELNEFQCFQNWFLNLSGERERRDTRR